MKTIADFIKLIQSGAQPVVQFKQGIDEKESYAENGMRARALRVNMSDHEVVKIMFDFQSFDQHNTPLESAHYYDSKGAPTRTAREAGYYYPQEELYFDSDEELVKLFEIQAGHRVELFERYTAAGTDLSYVQWLEDQVNAK